MSQLGRSKVLFTAVSGLLGVALLVGLAVLPRVGSRAGGMVGRPAPDVTLPVVANGEPGSRMRLSDLEGRPVILDFWASWCGPCAVQAPILERVARRHRSRGLVVLGINVGDAAADTRSYAERKGLSYPVALDPGDLASRSYGVSSLPSLVVIDRTGTVVAFLTGIVDESALDELVAAAL